MEFNNLKILTIAKKEKKKSFNIRLNTQTVNAPCVN